MRPFDEIVGRLLTTKAPWLWVDTHPEGESDATLHAMIGTNSRGGANVEPAPFRGEQGCRSVLGRHTPQVADSPFDCGAELPPWIRDFPDDLLRGSFGGALVDLDVVA